MNWNVGLTVIVLPLCISLCNAGDPCPPPSQLGGLCKCSRQIHRVAASPQTHRPQHGYREANLSYDESLPENTTLQITEDETLQTLENYTEVAIEGKRNNKEVPMEQFTTTVECTIRRNVLALEQIVIPALHRKLVDNLIVSTVLPRIEQGLVRLPSRWLRNTRVKQIEILHTMLAGDFIWAENPLEGQENSLIVMKVNYCSLKGALTHDIVGTVNTKSLDQFPNMEVLDLSRNNLVIITTDAFKKPPANLSTINLSFNNIDTLEKGAFKSIPLLKSLDLSHNLLESVTRNILAAPAKQLEIIDLSWNFIKDLPADLFSNMPVLTSVNMAKNYLYTLSDKPWTVVWNQLSFSDVSGNFINCDCNLLWMFKNSGANSAPNMAKRAVNGTCISHHIEPFFSIEYSLQSLRVNQLMCKMK